MKIQQVEELVGISKKNIRFYEEQGLLSPGRAENGYREYGQGDVLRLQQIKLLRKLAVSIEDIRPNVRFVTKDDYAIIAMVEKGLGIAIMPELLLQGRRDNIAALELKPQANRTIALAVTEAGERSPATREFADFVVSRVKGIK